MLDFFVVFFFGKKGFQKAFQQMWRVSLSSHTLSHTHTLVCQLFIFTQTVSQGVIVIVNVHGACIGHREIVQLPFWVRWDDKRGLNRDEESPDKELQHSAKKSPPPTHPI